MDTNLFEIQAIKFASMANWEKAVEINKKLLEIQPRDIAALNRLGRAYFELGRLNEARKTYKKVLRIDRYNQIANKSLERLAGLKSIKKRAGAKEPQLKEIFLEEPGKTKVVKLIHLAPPSVLSQLANAEEVLLVLKKRTINVLTKTTLTLAPFLMILPKD